MQGLPAKAVNDEQRHARGDTVLRDVGYEVRKQLRSFELVYRLGGEEFLVVLPGTPLDELFAQADASLYRAKAGGRNRVEVARPDAGPQLAA